MSRVGSRGADGGIDLPDRDGLGTTPGAPPASGSQRTRWSWAEIERAAGGPTICGNELRLQFEGSSTFSAWIEAIEGARRYVYFENYLLRDDEVGRQLRDALVRKARQGIPVYLIYDWLGCWATGGSYWRPMVKAGVHVRPFNKPAVRLGDPFGVLQRDHRKLVVVDGDIAHVGGLCVGVEWAGTPTRAPWRDTGVEIRGPAARAAALAFERVWAELDRPLSLAGAPGTPPEEGDTPVWLIEGEPGRARVYRTLHLAASRARHSIWITDAYFVAPRPLSEALSAAAQQGVDVRILVPAHNNWPIVGTMSRGGYRPLLEAGVRIFEWQGPMMHAKTSVVDGEWCRVGSSNLNAASLMGNWELDVGVLDEGFGRQLAGLFLADLTSSSEIVLPGRRSRAMGPLAIQPPAAREAPDADGAPPGGERRRNVGGTGHARLSMASVVRAGAALGGALAGDRALGREDRTVLGTVSVALLFVALLGAILPAVVGWMVTIGAGWLGLTTGVRAFLQARRTRAAQAEVQDHLGVNEGGGDGE